MGESLKVEWSEDLSTGNPGIDAQHKYLIEIINELAEAIEEKHAAKKLRTILNLLKYYAEWHFDREEKCMHRLKCPAYAENLDAHQYFIVTFKKFEAEYVESGGSESIAMRMYTTLTDWLVNHIKKVDGQLRYCTPKDERSTAGKPLN